MKPRIGSRTIRTLDYSYSYRPGLFVPSLDDSYHAEKDNNGTNSPRYEKSRYPVYIHGLSHCQGAGLAANAWPYQKCGFVGVAIDGWRRINESGQVAWL